MSFLNQALSFFSIGPNRSFAGISGYVTISEATQDNLKITQQPVQQGASIADHVFKDPVSISIQMQFSDNLFQSLSTVYQQLLTLQTNFTPFSVVTPKRTYNNMLLATLGVTTDKKSENILLISATFQEVIIVPVVTTTITASQLASSANNLGVAAVGNKSALFTLLGPK